MRKLASGLILLGFALTAAACKTTGIEVHHLKFVGVKQIDANDLKGVLATRPSSKLPWGKKNYFDRAKFEADLKRVLAFYADRGFPDARVTDFDVALNEPQTKVDITVDIAEGTPAIATNVAFNGFEELPEPARDTLLSQAPLRSGGRLDRSAINQTREMALNALRDNGYPYAKVGIGQQPTPDPKKVDVTFTATPGVKAYFGAIDITGNKSVDDNVIRQELRYKPGDLYRRNVLLFSQRRLYNLQLFQFANIQPVNVEAQPAEVPTRITVAEGKQRRLEFSGGFGTEEKARGEVRWRNVNFLGGAREFEAHGKWSSLDRGVRAEFTQPHFPTSTLAMGLEAHQWYENEPAFTERSSGGRVTLTRRVSPRNTWTLGFNDEYTSSTISEEALNDPTQRSTLIALGLNPVTGTQTGTLASVSFGLVRSTATPNPLNATRGYYVSSQLEQAGHFAGGTFGFSALAGEGRVYFPATRTTVVAVRMRYGTLRPQGGDDTQVPFSRRVFLGGSDSLRGWGRFEVSPLSEGLPIGGFTMFVGTTELRKNLTDKLGAVGFLDFGNVWATTWNVYFNDLRYDVGVGLRYGTPVGPFRVDVGYQLNPIPGLLVNGEPQTRRWRIHFSIGQAF